MTRVVTSTKEMQELRSSVDGDLKLALVPTMGALHEGHLSLVKKAQEFADIVVVSIFVNPLQFGPNEDFKNYPRTFDEDLKKCEGLSVDYIFAPTVDDIYPNGEVNTGMLKANPDLANKLCGLSRPGHFDGVCTIVKKLFDIVCPHFAIFGEKDFQQLEIIKDMVNVNSLSVEIISAPIVRELSGLAMSSRNKYLSVEASQKAALINLELKKIAALISQFNDLEQVNLIRSGGEELINQTISSQIKDIFQESKIALEKENIQIEYIEVFKGRICIAAKLGSTRLIDNIELSSF